MKRVISGIVMVALAFLIFIPGGWVTLLGVSIFTIGAMVEFYRAFGISKKPIAFVAYAFVILYEVMLAANLQSWIAVWLAFAFIAVFGIYVLHYEEYKLEEIFATFIGIIYIGFLLSHCYLLRVHEHGAIFIMLAFASACGSDSFAYFVGSKFGKHKMTPVLSPKKSIEGSIGGITITTVLGFGLIVLLKHLIPSFDFPTWAAVVIMFVGTIVGQIGDLVASAVKRQKGIKDYGNLIPGHGGLLDRIDSYLFVMPIAYYLILVFEQVLGIG